MKHRTAWLVAAFMLLASLPSAFGQVRAQSPDDQFHASSAVIAQGEIPGTWDFGNPESQVCDYADREHAVFSPPYAKVFARRGHSSEYVHTSTIFYERLASGSYKFLFPLYAQVSLVHSTGTLVPFTDYFKVPAGPDWVRALKIEWLDSE